MAEAIFTCESENPTSRLFMVGYKDATVPTFTSPQPYY